MPTTRRFFLQGGALGVLALRACWMPFRADTHPGAGQLRIDRIFYDIRRPEALEFGETARLAGARTLPISGNVEDPCYEDLRGCWRSATSPVAGITDFRVLFLMQMMASDVGLRPVLRIHHIGRGASLVHETFGSGAALAASRTHLSRAGLHWSGPAARLVMNLAAVDRAAMYRAADMRAANLRAFDSQALVTWVIA